MSTYWDFYCVECEKWADIDINHGDSVLKMAMRVWPQVRAVWESDATARCYFEPNIMGYGDAPFGFLREHEGHTLQIKSEHGDIALIEEDIT